MEAYFSAVSVEPLTGKTRNFSDTDPSFNSAPSRCADRATLASTSPGSRVVYICSPQFMEKQHRDPALAAVLVIHEELHSLDLSENPPTSQAITAQVIARCGR